MNKQMRGNLMLLLTALILGSSYVAFSTAMEYVGPYTFTAVRYLIGGLVLIPVNLVYTKMDSAKLEAGENAAEKDQKAERKTLVMGGLCCGFAAFVACVLQQIGIMYTTAGKAGFITTLYVVIVPILGIFIGKKVRPIVWMCVCLAVIGLYLLCMSGSFAVNKGDVFVLLCAFAFAVYILLIDHFSPKTSGVALSCVTFFVCGLVALIPAFIFETPTMSDIFAGWLPILYVGIFNCGVALTLQIVAQKYTNPTTASLILGLESVFSLIFGMLILHEQVSPRGLLGCAFMLAAIIIAQLPAKEE